MELDEIIINDSGVTVNPVGGVSTAEVENSLYSTVTNRFSDAPWARGNNSRNSVVVGGLGGIGSNLFYMLAKFGTYVHAYEDDIVEEHNIGRKTFKFLHFYLTF